MATNNSANYRPTQYYVQAGSTNGQIQDLASLGTSGQVLTSNGAGALPTWQASGGSSTFTVATGTLTNAQIKALHATPVQLIAAQGAGKVIVAVQAVGKLIYGGSNAFTASVGQSINLTYGGANTVNFVNGGAILGNTPLTATSNQYYITLGTQNSAGPFTATSYENVAIYAYNSSTTEISGNAANNNTVSWMIAYQVISI